MSGAASLTTLGEFERGLSHALELRLPAHSPNASYPLGFGPVREIAPLESLALLLKRGFDIGKRWLIIGGAAPHAHPVWQKLVKLARKIGYEQVWMIVHSAAVPETESADAPLDGLIVIQDESAPIRSDSRKMAKAWFSWRILEETNADRLMADIDSDLACGAAAVLLGYPLGGLRDGDSIVFPRTYRIRSKLISLKRTIISRNLPVALWGLPICALSFGEPDRLRSLPLPDVSDLTDSAPWPPVSAWRAYAPHGVLPCACLERAACAVLPQSYGKQHRVPATLGTDYLQAPDDSTSGIVVRPTLRCNQNCGFCFVRHDGPDVDFNEITSRLTEMGAKEIVISGGEPSLYKDLNALIRWAKNELKADVTLQTNATRYASEQMADDLIATGLDRAFVSLHSHDAAISDEITKLDGSFAKTIAGIRNLAQLPEGVTINHVLSKANYHQLVNYVHFLDQTFPMRNSTRYKLNLAFVGIMGNDMQPDVETFVPRLSDVSPHLNAACEFLVGAEIRFEGLDTMCGLPRCILHFDARFYPPAKPLHSDDFVKGPQCARCRYSPFCYGVRRNYAAVYGTDELTPDEKAKA